MQLSTRPRQPLSQAKPQVGLILYCLYREEGEENREQCELEFWLVNRSCGSVSRDTVLCLLLDRDVIWMLRGGREEFMISISLRQTIVLHQLHTLIVTRCGKVCRGSGVRSWHQRSTQANSKFACNQQVSEREVLCSKPLQAASKRSRSWVR